MKWCGDMSAFERFTIYSPFRNIHPDRGLANGARGWHWTERTNANVCVHDVHRMYFDSKRTNRYRTVINHFT